MSKETLIVFVYDTEYCKDETYDPINAVLYFHPGWVSDIQKVALCGQLMGTSHFLKNCFFRPKIIALQNGKFVFRELGRFIVAIGTDRNISDYLLEHRAHLLTSLIEFFHRDLQNIYDQFSVTKGHKNLSEKLYHIFGTYLPILQFDGNRFQNVPKLHIPRIASNIFLTAMQFLQSCQQVKGVLGGTILYHNKIVATQLSDVVTKNIVFTDPHRIKSTAEPISVNFHVPVGVQMIVVYIPICQYRLLSANASRSQSLQTQNLSSINPSGHFQKRKIKRDISLIFTNIPEENNCDQFDIADISAKANRMIARQNVIQSKNAARAILAETTSSNCNDLSDYKEYVGRTSICSTPMTENKILPGNGILSICAVPQDNFSVAKSKINKAIKIDFDKMLSNFINTSKMERRNSLSDLQDSLKKISRKFSFKKFPISKPKLNNSDESICDEMEDVTDRSVSRRMHKICRAASDPTHPGFDDNDDIIIDWVEEEPVKEGNTTQTEEKSEPDNLSRNSSIESQCCTEAVENLSEKLTEKCHYKSSKAKTRLDKMSLSLPLKNCNDIQNDSTITLERKRLSGIQLTPLMSKLSILSFGEDNLNLYSRNNQREDLGRHSDDNGQRSNNRQLGPQSQSPTRTSEEYQKVELYVCGQQNMTMFLLLEQGASSKQEIVQSMFDKCLAKLGKMEAHLHQTLNVNMMENMSEGGYSLICLDSKWDTLLNSGPWTPLDHSFLEHIQIDLNRGRQITDILLRTNDCTLYGYKSARTEIFFKESAHYFAGIPPPSDPMGSVAARAKVRLEEDFSLVFF